MEGKEEISDTDSGVILHSGPDSPTTVMKDVNTHTRVMKLKQQALEDRLKICLLELKKLCIREAELTGHLSSDYPLLPGEKPPQIRRRIGAAFKLDEPRILNRTEDSELSSVEADLALQQQIYVASQRLCQEEHLSKAVKRSRLQQYQREERKLKELQEAVFRLRLKHGRSSPRPGMITQRLCTSDNSSLSDSAVLDEEELSSQLSSEPPAPAIDFHAPPQTNSYPPSNTPIVPSYQPLEATVHQTPPQSLEDLHTCQSPILEHDPAPIQNSPWMESSLDQPYQKKKKSHSSSIKSSSPAVTPTLPPLEVCLEEARISLQIPTHAALKHTQSCSAPSTPEMHLRRIQSFRVPNTDPNPYDPKRERGRSMGPRRGLTDFAVTPSEYSPISLNVGNPLYYSSSEDSNSEHSVHSYTSSPCQEHPGELPWPNQPQYGYQYTSFNDNHIPQRCSPTPFYKNAQYQSSSSFSRGYVEDGCVHPLEMDSGRLLYMRHQAPSPVYSTNGHYEYCYSEALPSQQGSCRLLPTYVKLSRAPSLREYPHHPNRGLPRQVVSEELKSWHQRNQLRPPRPHSLDRNRQGALRIRNVPGQESPLSLSQHHRFQEQQISQKQVVFRTPDRLYEDDSEVASQV
ncbi:innate immunity activator protein-like isoform X1 [Carassius carassius]|uniref:innate immunity activator protein-like isoform X1 n=1 Tax=Carassius carassius TaxID=217509 RepID=UPI002868BE6A|nr:innate immunity activator protein-like isoform X1 [Carassius carassius]XP_059393733.1 innate immunity activator protein-like isoform X1 [Carassius carassius]XP_059393734.1 innate immunity activator protein-like isoform X1 [Carassius carassius]XP_059393735.1 innate immunity activator protein-like isoform X1 [Carassius carassius]XP_059393736.1 innate immunity activator protein-like isoform X1 [Carassius carassius]